MVVVLSYTSNNRSGKAIFVPNIQIARAIAAICVIIIHSVAPVVRVGRKDTVDMSFLQIGVDIFFVISGFIMMHVERSSGFVQAISFLKHRAIRIIPIYWIFTSIAVVYFLYNNGSSGIHLSQVRRIVTSYMFWPHSNVPGEMGNSVPMLSVGWTLNAEMFFYLIFALSFCFKSRAMRSIFVSSLIVSIVIIHVKFELSMPLFFWSDPIMIEFVFGVIIGSFYDSIVKISSRVILLLLGFTLLYFSFVTIYLENIIGMMMPHPELWRPLCWGLPAAFFVLCLVSIKDLSNTTLGRYFLALGAASYSIYISHTITFDLLYLISECFSDNNSTFDSFSTSFLQIISIIIAIFMGCIIYKLIESPIAFILKKFR